MAEPHNQANLMITDIAGLAEAKDDDGGKFLVLTALLDDGKPIRLTMSEETAARMLLLLERARRKLGWQLRDDVSIEENDLQ